MTNFMGTHQIAFTGSDQSCPVDGSWSYVWPASFDETVKAAERELGTSRILVSSPDSEVRHIRLTHVHGTVDFYNLRAKYASDLNRKQADPGWVTAVFRSADP